MDAKLVKKLNKNADRIGEALDLIERALLNIGKAYEAEPDSDFSYVISEIETLNAELEDNLISLGGLIDKMAKE